MPGKLRIGLTGGIASGKSTVSQRFSELGVPVIDADLAARNVVEPGSIGLERVVGRFGPRVLTADGRLDRGALRSVIFADSNARAELNAILHPLIRSDMEQRAAAAVGPYLVFAIPLLVESGSPHERVDRVVVVDVEESLQLERLASRDGSSADEARAILKSQATRAARLDVADDVIVNSGSLAALRNAVDALHARYLDIAATCRSN
jgi:dephospho-CoA kinase